MAGEVQGIFHPVINVSDMDRAVAFFGGVLGLRQTFDDVHDPAAIEALFGFKQPQVRSVVFECGDGSEFELTQYHDPKGRQQNTTAMNDVGMVALALRVSGLRDLMPKVEAAGYLFPSGLVEQTLPDGAILKVAVCIGPDAVKVILVEPPLGRKSLEG
jgi:catechol 2,3-dioxygenase-like lactoylglutathione lyase family enzyme